jgi:pyruvate dehydrogenase E1 component
MAFVRILTALVRDKGIGPRIVPIVPDEARTFGMEGMFRQIGIYAPFGQKYRPQDADQLMYYREDQKGQVLQEGISEPGAMSAGWRRERHCLRRADAAVLHLLLIAGFQRVGTQCRAAGDMRRIPRRRHGRPHDANGEVCSTRTDTASSGRRDSNCRAYDPTFSYEVAVILQDGVRRMLSRRLLLLVTVMNENYTHPDMPVGAEANIIKGMYPFRDGAAKENGNGKAR